MVAVAACAALLALAIFLLRKYGGKLPILTTAGKRVRVLERTVIASQVQLVVVAYDDRMLLLSVSPAGATCLRDEPASLENTSPVTGEST
jgi:flagellar biogenesis protein FliO